MSQKVNMKCVSVFVCVSVCGGDVQSLLGTQSASVPLCDPKDGKCEVSQWIVSDLMILAANWGSTAFLFPSIPSTALGQAPDFPALEGPQSSKSGPGSFTFYAQSLAMALFAILQVSSYPRSNIADCQRQISHLTKDMLQNQPPGSNTFLLYILNFKCF